MVMVIVIHVHTKTKVVKIKVHPTFRSQLIILQTLAKFRHKESQHQIPVRLKKTAWIIQ